MNKILLPVLIVIVFVLGFFTSKDTLTRIYTDLRASPAPVSTECDAICQKEIAGQVSQKLAVESVTTPRLATGSPKPTAKPQDSYITIPGLGSTTNTDWTDVAGTDFSFDVSKDFQAQAHLSWSGFLRVANANGTGYARIYDTTHGIGVDGSQILITDSADYLRAVSGNLGFWSGRNIYRIQIKSLNSLDVDYMGGSIRVSY